MKIVNAALCAAFSVTLTGLVATPAQAQAGVVLISTYGPSGSVDGSCAYAMSLPQTGDFNRIPIAFTGEASAVSSRLGVVPVSTSIRCYLQDGASGSNGSQRPARSSPSRGPGPLLGSRRLLRSAQL